MDLCVIVYQRVSVVLKKNFFMGGKDVDISMQGVSCNDFCAHVAKSNTMFLFFYPKAIIFPRLFSCSVVLCYCFTPSFYSRKSNVYSFSGSLPCFYFHCCTYIGVSVGYQCVGRPDHSHLELAVSNLHLVRCYS